MKRLVVQNLKLLLREPVHKTVSNLPSHRGYTAHNFLRGRSFHKSSSIQAVKPYLLADIGEGEYP